MANFFIKYTCTGKCHLQSVFSSGCAGSGDNVVLKLRGAAEGRRELEGGGGNRKSTL